MKRYIIEKEKIEHNIELIKQKALGAKVYAVVKADGYGLGLLGVVSVLRARGIDAFGVTNTKDALTLRQNGCGEVLLLAAINDEAEIETLIKSKVVLTIGSYQTAVLTNGIAQRLGVAADVHIEIDTGMGRYGFLTSQQDQVLSVYKYLKNLNPVGFFTHLSCAFSKKNFTKIQVEKLVSVANMLRTNGYNPGTLHCANSSGLFRYDFTRLDAVRAGSAITGRLPAKGGHGLKKVGYLESAVTQVRGIQKGDTVSYGATFKAKRHMQIAVVPVGYFDGFGMDKARDAFRIRDVFRYILSDFKRFFFGKRTYVEINGKRARVIGRVAMLNFVVDVSHMDCKPGDPVIMQVSPLFLGPEVEKVYV